MGDQPVDELMDIMEERAEVTLKLLRVLDTAEMMRVTRESILEWIEEGLRSERARFRALGAELYPAHMP